jgi:hypothetical protein
MKKKRRRRRKRKKEKNKKRKKQKEKNKYAPRFFLASFKSWRALKTSPYSIFPNHVQSDNENFIRVLGSPICHLHMSTFLNVRVPSLSFSNIYFPWPF